MTVGPVAARAKREESERERLTAPGWPRPQAPGPDDRMLPVPWIVPPPEWATMNPDRGFGSLEERLCQVCGEGHDPDPQTRCVIFQSGPLLDAETVERLSEPDEYPRRDGDVVVPPRVLLTALDGGMLHERCAKLSVAKCPHLSRAFAGDRLFAFTVPVADLVVIRKDGKPSIVRAPGDRAEVWNPPRPRRG